MIEVLQPGIQTSIQDSNPRHGLEHGVPQGGASDLHAAQLANIILGQSPSLPVLEITSSSFSIRFNQSARISLTGGGMIWQISGVNDMPSNEHLSDIGDYSSRHIGSWREHSITAGTILTGRPTRPGFRSYLGITGGFQSQEWLRSHSTELRLHAGGSIHALKKGDLLYPSTPVSSTNPRGSSTSREFTTSSGSNTSGSNTSGSNTSHETNNPRGSNTSRGTNRKWHLSRDFTSYLHTNEIRIFPAPESNWFPENTLHELINHRWIISRDSNRMGIRLEAGQINTQQLNDKNLISTVVLPGTIQLTPSGPIILGPDAQTSGGYPRIAQICQYDLRILAQKAPGDEIHLRWITLADAIDLRDQYQTEVRQLQNAIRLMH